MGISTPNREADPVTLESYEPPCILKQEGGLFIDFYNDEETTFIAGEPTVFLNRVCIVQKTTLPGKPGVMLTDWIVDAILDPELDEAIEQNQLIYWDLDIDAVRSIPGGVLTSGIGAATVDLPANGFILGRAIVIPQRHDGSKFAAVAGQRRVRVASLPGVATAYGDEPSY